MRDTQRDREGQRDRERRRGYTHTRRLPYKATVQPLVPLNTQQRTRSSMHGERERGRERERERDSDAARMTAGEGIAVCAVVLCTVWARARVSMR